MSEKGQCGDATKERVLSCLNANHANTLAMLECLRACDVDLAAARPYREVEDGLGESPSFKLCTQTPHVLIGLLVEAGAICSLEVPEADVRDSEEADASPTMPELGEPEDTADDNGEGERSEHPDRPVDRVLYLSEAGRAVLADFDPARRFAELLASEPEGYLDVYAAVLDICSGDQGASRGQIEQAVCDMPALFEPKRVYASYFVSKLETIGGLIWDGAWRTSDAGEHMLDAVAAR